MKQLVSFLFAFGMFGLFVCNGATLDAYWTGKGGDNKWSNAENWNPKKVPDGNADKNDYRVHVSKTCEIEIDAGQTFKTYWFYPDSGAQVTLTGSGTLDNANWTFIDKGASMIVDGPTVTIYNTVNGIRNTIKGEIRVKSGFLKIAKSTLMLSDDARVFVEGGEFGVKVGTNNSIVLTNNAELVISGGLARFYQYTVYGPYAEGEKGGLIRLTGGTLNNTYGNYCYTSQIKPGGRLENLGGTILWGTDNTFLYSRLSSSGTGSQGQGTTFSNFLPRVGAVLNIPSRSTTNGGALYFTAIGDYGKVGGTIYATNATEEAMGNVCFNSTSVALRGGATVYANALNIAKSEASSYDLDLTRLNLGMGGIRRTANNKTQTMNFLDGIVFGAWGDYVTTNHTSVTLVPSGPVAYDTLDCFDQTTAHAIAMSRIKMDAVTDLKATGGGSVKLNPISFKEELRTLEVAAGTTLEVTNKVALKAMNLKLGANATLKIDLKNAGYVDAAAVAEFGTGAKIVVTALPVLEEGKLYPVYFAPAGTTPDLAKIEFAAGVLPDGWTLAKTANNVYLTDSKTEPYAAPVNRYWTGDGADNLYSNTENWNSGSVPGSGADAYFYGARNTAIDIGSALTIREFCIGANAGPFVFGGSTVSFGSPGDSDIDSHQASVRNDGKFAVVVANSVDSAKCYRFISIDEGSVSMTGGSQGANASIPLNFGGDVRLGGAWTVAWMRAQAKNYSNNMTTKTATCPSRLTVMPGATLTVADQACDVNEAYAGALAIAKNGTATISGSGLTFSKDNAHYVDGTLTVNCPLVTPARQTFRGDGTLKLLGGVAASETGIVRVEGNLTLVPSNWVNAVTLSVKDNVTIAPEGDWTLGSAGTLELEDHSTLTLATGGRTVTFAAPVDTAGTVALTGAGKLAIGAAGTKIGKVTCADGAKITFADGFGSRSAFTDILAVREPDDSIAFDENLKVRMRYDQTTDETIYSAKVIPGLVLLVK